MEKSRNNEDSKENHEQILRDNMKWQTKSSCVICGSKLEHIISLYLVNYDNDNTMHYFYSNMSYFYLNNKLNN